MIVHTSFTQMYLTLLKSMRQINSIWRHVPIARRIQIQVPLQWHVIVKIEQNLSLDIFVNMRQHMFIIDVMSVIFLDA